LRGRPYALPRKLEETEKGGVSGEGIQVSVLHGNQIRSPSMNRGKKKMPFSIGEKESHV